jgi:hypothetical protein
LSPVFFTDRDLGKRFPDILAAAGLCVERHHDLFPPDCPDEVWLEYVGKNSRVAITHDRRIRYKPNELAAVMRHRVGLLVVVGKLKFAILAHHFVATMPRIVSFLEQHEPPFIAKVYRPASPDAENPSAMGSVVLWHP